MSISKLLRDCHRLRRHLREIQQEIELGPRVLKIQQQTLAAAEAAHKEYHETIKKLKLKQKEDEGTLKQTESALAKYQVDVNAASSKKEYEAKLTEIATATQKKSTLEDTILVTIMEIEERTAGIPAAEATWAAAQAEFQKLRQEATERMERLAQEQVAAQEQLNQVEAQLPVEVRPQVARLVKSYGADGFAAAKGKTCSHCRTAITEQQRTVLLGGGFFCCASCGRGLYLVEG